MRLGVRVDSWRGTERLARGLLVVGWAWSEKHPAIPAGRFTADFPGDSWPLLMSDPLMPMGQWLRAEILHDDQTTTLPPLRIVEASEGSGVVSVVCDTIDLDISEDPWPFPSSPATGSSLLREANRLASPRRAALAIPDSGLPDGIAWSGDRDDALLELAASRSARWELDRDGTLILKPLGNPSEPERVYTAREVITAPRKRTRNRVTKATVVGQGSQDDPPIVVTRRLTDPAYAPDVYGTVGVVETDNSGADSRELSRRADSLLVEGGGQREFTMLPDPTLRAGMAVRVEVERRGEPNRRDGREVVLGRVVSHTLNDDGSHSITVQEA